MPYKYLIFDPHMLGGLEVVSKLLGGHLISLFPFVIVVDVMKHRHVKNAQVSLSDVLIRVSFFFFFNLPDTLVTR